MFNVNKDYWYYKGLNYGKSREAFRKKRTKEKLKEELEKLPLEELKQICSLFNISVKDTNDKKHFSETLIKDKAIAIHLYMLFSFLKEYTASISEYIRQNSDSNDKSSQYLKLIKLFLEYEKVDHLSNILINYNWNAAGTGTKLESKEKLADDAITKFETASPNFAKKISTRNIRFSAKKTKYFGRYDNIFMFDRQVADKVIQTISKPQRFKPSRYVLIKFEEKGLEIRELRSHNYAVDKIKSSLEKFFNIELENTSDRPAKGDVSKFIKRFTTKPKTDTRLSIIALKLKKSNLIGALPIEIDNFQAGTDIVDAIKDMLENREIAELQELTDVDYFDISYSSDGDLGIRKRIKVRENEYGAISLEADSKSMSQNERQGFYSAFEEQFGLALNFPLDPTNLTTNRERTIDYVLSEGKFNSSRKFLADMAKDLKSKGLIKIEEKYCRKCTKCGKKSFYEHDDTECRDCHRPTKLLSETPQLNIKLNDVGVKRYVKDFILKGTEIKEIGNRKLSIKNMTFSFVEYEYKKRPLLVHISKNKLSRSAVKNLESLALPILFINTTKGADSNIRGNLFEQISLNFIIESEAEAKKKVNLAFDNLLGYELDRINIAAQESSKNMENKLKAPDTYPWAEFQTDVLNIIKQVFPTAHKGGSKYVPEGFAGTSYTKNGAIKKKTFEWDCKLAKSGFYKLTQAEIDQAWRYIRSSLNSEELVSFSGGLSSYMIISNKIDDNNFKNFSASLNKKTSWHSRRSVVCFMADAIIELQKQYAQHQLNVTSRPNVFYHKFFKMIEKVDGKTGYVKIDSNTIKLLFTSVANEPKEFDAPNWPKVAEHLKKDED